MINIIKRLLFVLLIVPYMVIMVLAFLGESLYGIFLWILTGTSSGIEDPFKAFISLHDALLKFMGWKDSYMMEDDPY